MSAITVKAPGRICLFGDHQDYLELPIIACAIDRYITISGVANGEDYLDFHLPNLRNGEGLSFRETCLDVSGSIQNPQNKNHLTDTLNVVRRYGCRIDKGYSITITGDIPINAGLSSSSAVVVAWTQWLLATFGCTSSITPELVAHIAYEAEVLEQNSPGGKMDQYTSALGNILYLETDKQSNFKNLGTELEGLIIGVSGIPKDTIGLLGDLRGNALRAVEKVTSTYSDFMLSTATLRDYELYKDILNASELPFFYAAIQNHLITKEALVCFRETCPDVSGSVLNYKKIGHLMTAHHKVLRDSLKITVPRIDAMIHAALNAGALGAKIVGSGGGGSICALAPKGKEPEIIKAITNAGAIAAYKVNVSQGVQTL